MATTVTPSLCVASGDDAVRSNTVAVLAAQGYPTSTAASLSELAGEVAGGWATVLVDPDLPGLDGAPLVRLRAEPALHRCRLLLLDGGEVGALRAPRPAPALVSLLLRLQRQVAGDAQVELLREVGERLTASPELGPTMDAVLDACAAHVGFDTGTLFMLGDDGLLEARAARGYELDYQHLRRFAPGEGVVGWVVANRAPTIVGDSHADRRFATADARGPRTLVAAPILLGERVLGALTLVRRFPGEQFSDAELVLVATIGSSAGAALENARLYERDREISQRLAEVDRTLGQERDMLRRLETYDRLYTQVVATVSHELKTPLMGIRGFAKLLADGSVDAAEARDFAREIHENAIRLSRYVEAILDEETVHAGRVELQLGPLDVHEIASQALRALAAAAGPRHTLVNAVPRRLPAMVGDSDRILRVLTNLVSNAIKYSPAGGRVLVSAAPDGDGVLITVEDQGVGIPAEARERVFDRFYRVTSEATKNIPGTGLGLSIVIGLVELHGGRIWVEQGSGGRGSRFCMRLPTAGARAPHLGPVVAVRPEQGSAHSNGDAGRDVEIDILPALNGRRRRGVRHQFARFAAAGGHPEVP